MVPTPLNNVGQKSDGLLVTTFAEKCLMLWAMAKGKAATRKFFTKQISIEGFGGKWQWGVSNFWSKVNFVEKNSKFLMPICLDVKQCPVFFCFA